jgi:hypothetical protein
MRPGSSGACVPASALFCAGRITQAPPSGAAGRSSRSGSFDLNRDVWGCPPNLRKRTHVIAPATAGQMAVGPARVIKSPSISKVTTRAKAIMGASRMRPARTAADAQFRSRRAPLPLNEKSGPESGWRAGGGCAPKDPISIDKKPAPASDTMRRRQKARLKS